ncbi:hypothetical protein EJB05_09609, partial [Eragrostis curvula]
MERTSKSNLDGAYHAGGRKQREEANPLRVEHGARDGLGTLEWMRCPSGMEARRCCSGDLASGRRKRTPIP